MSLDRETEQAIKEINGKMEANNTTLWHISNQLQKVNVMHECIYLGIKGILLLLVFILIAIIYSIK
jgi:hypothetical protein